MQTKPSTRPLTRRSAHAVGRRAFDRSARALASLIAWFAIAACSPEVVSRPAPTQIMLRLDASGAVQSRLTKLRITLARPLAQGSETDAEWVTASTLLERRKLRFPIDVPILPKSRVDSFSRFEVVIDALEGDTPFAQARAVTTFVPQERRVLPLSLDLCSGMRAVCAPEDCHGPECKVCRRDGSCAPVGFTEATELSTLDESAAASDAGAPRADATAAANDGEVRERDDGATDPSSDEDAGLDPDIACDSEGALRCSAQGTSLRELCQGGRWTESEPCPAASVCDPEGTLPGSCRELAEVCLGSAERAVCDREQLLFCTAQGEIDPMKTEACKSERHCTLGASVGKCAVCLPGEHRCDGAKLEVCNDDGQGFRLAMTCSSAALCNATAGACTSAPCIGDSARCVGDRLELCRADQSGFDPGVACMPGLCDAAGKQCDSCPPNKRACDGNTVLTCSADGQTTTKRACSAPTPLCTGEGVCVACTVEKPCAAPSEPCKTSSCDLARGACVPGNKASGTSCGGGKVCNGAGACVACITADQCQVDECATPLCNADNTCGSRPKSAGTPCSTGVCNGAGRCVACTLASQCQANLGECLVPTCNGNACGSTPKRAGTACQGGVCNGTGQCVGCTQANQCQGNLGECSAPTCNNDVCGSAPKSAGTPCQQGVCNGAGRCVACTKPEHCNQPQSDCMEATCDMNVCGSRPKSRGATCRTGACNGSGQCLECLSSAQCTSAGERVCSPSNQCVECTSADARACAANEYCTANNTCAQRCGNGVLDPGEECEVNVGGWTAQTCSSSTCTRVAYTACASKSECLFTETCESSFSVCSNSCWGSDSNDSMGLCKSIPGYTRSCYLDYCLVRCNSAGGCPRGLVCQDNPDYPLFVGHCISPNSDAYRQSRSSGP